LSPADHGADLAAVVGDRHQGGARTRRWAASLDRLLGRVLQARVDRRLDLQAPSKARWAALLAAAELVDEPAA